MFKKGRKKKITGLPDSDDDDAYSDDDDVGSTYSDRGRGLGRGGGVQIVGGPIGRRGQCLLVGGDGDVVLVLQLGVEVVVVRG